MYWKETGDTSVWHGVAQDAIVMNLDDMACVGMVNDFMLSNTITRNKHLIPGAVISAIIEGTDHFLNIHIRCVQRQMGGCRQRDGSSAIMGGKRNAM